MKEHYTKRQVRIPMRDGITLFTAIYEPKDNTEKHPILMTRTCYSVGSDETNLRSLTSSSVENYVMNNYIFVYQDVRGKNMSEGEFDDIRPFIENKKLNKKPAKNVGQTDEASDTYDTVEWLVHNTNNNGCVGAYGISYPGFYTTMVGLSGHPAVKAVSPQAPVTDWYHGDDVHHNGAFMLGEMVAFQPFFEYLMNNKYVLGNNGKGTPNFKFPSLFHSDLYTDYLNIATYKNITEAYGDSLTYLRTIREHPNWDEYWESHTVTKGHMHDVKPAVMVVGGLFDKEDCYGAFDVYKSIKEQSPETDLYLVEGPWYHGGWARGMTQFFGNVYFGNDAISEYYVNNIEYPFFAYYLEGKGEKPKQEALMFDSGTNKWISYKEGWPLVKRAEATPYYLHSCGKVSTEAPTHAGVVSYVSDPAHPVPYRQELGTSINRNYMVDDQRFAAQRPDVATFKTDVLTTPLQLAGEIEVELNVDLSTTDADFIVKVIDVFPDDFSYQKMLGEEEAKKLQIPNYTMAGYQLMVRGEVMRGKFRESFSEPKPFEPGKTTKVKFTMPDVSHTFLPGHR
ncbi:MAG: CocE/NonD family hydrolase, partial [Bacteroidaceae bacterium]|nr:CocE/NonD family hydrolase [Bacteroidaceae bacterium]